MSLKISTEQNMRNSDCGTLLSILLHSNCNNLYMFENLLYQTCAEYYMFRNNRDLCVLMIKNFKTNAIKL